MDEIVEELITTYNLSVEDGSQLLLFSETLRDDDQAETILENVVTYFLLEEI